MISRRTLMARSLAVGALVAGGSMVSQPDEAAAATRPVHFRAWSTAATFGTGTRRQLTIDGAGGLLMTGRAGVLPYRDPFGTYRIDEYAQWVSPWVTPGFGATELIASWNAHTPTGTWVQIAVQVITTSGATTGWYVLGRHTTGDSAADIHRVSVDGQADTHGTVLSDTFATRGGHTVRQYRVRVQLVRPGGTAVMPRLTLVSVVASALPTTAVATSALGGAQGTTLAVPTYSQRLHLGHLPQYGGGGASWCSATSLAMVLDYHRIGPTAAETSWVKIAGETRPQVDHVARHVYDHTYAGCGNWPFNTAYAATRGARAFVTRLRSLTEAEKFISQGLPLIASVRFTSAELTGAGYSTDGHLLVIAGFAANGDVVVNDPNSHLKASDAQVRTTYRRGQFENVWLPRSGGVVYVIVPKGKSLPSNAGGMPWG